jgi:hypothetical protein
MPDMAETTLTEQQRKWMASVRASLETSTGRSLADWIEIAKTCPETAPKARQRWFKETHGLGQNYYMMVMMAASEQAGAPMRDPAAFRKALWSDPAASAIFAALEAVVADLPDVVTGQRKTYTTWSRAYAFACARPLKGGKVRLGLAVEADVDARLEPAAKEGWSERLKASVTLSGVEEVDEALTGLLKAAWDKS